MVSSKDKSEAKKLSAWFRRETKKWLDDFYAKAAKDGRCPSELEAMQALGRSLEAETKGEWPSQPPDRPGVSDGVVALASPQFFSHAYVNAAAAVGCRIPKRNAGFAMTGFA